MAVPRIASKLSLPPGRADPCTELRRPACVLWYSHGKCRTGHVRCLERRGVRTRSVRLSSRTRRRRPAPARPIDPSPLRVETRALTVSGACTAWRTARSLENMIVSAVPCRRPWHRMCVDGGYATSPLPNGMGAHGRALHSENGLSMTNCLA